MSLNPDASLNSQRIIISKLLVHPIKSCRGTSVSEASYTPAGLDNDRKFVIVNAEDHKFITARECPKLVTIYPRIESEPSSPHGGLLHITFPEDPGRSSFSVLFSPTPEELSKWDVISDISLWKPVITDGYICPSFPPSAHAPSPSDILSSYLSRPVLLILKGPTPRPVKPTPTHPSLEGTTIFQDGYPLLVASTSSLESVRENVRKSARGEAGWVVGQMNAEKWMDGDVQIERFRPNIVISGAEPFAEDNWAEIEILSASDGANMPESSGQIALVSKCGRCTLPNVDPETGIPDAAVPYKVLQKFRRVDPNNKYTPVFGLNGVPLNAKGVYRVGGVVKVLKYA